jgi:hypothetical protein
MQKRMINWTQAKQIGFGYIAVLLFLGIFAMVLVYGHLLHVDLEQPTWAIVIAFILVLPIFIPSLLRYLGPRLTGIKVGNILELTLQQVKESSYSTNDLENKLIQTGIESVSAPEYANIMSSASSVIVQHIEEIKNNRYEVVVVDLKGGHSWVSPNLYFLALLLLRRTEVKQLAFVETRNKEEEFVGMSSPQEILHPEYEVAANSVCFSGLDSNECGLIANPNANFGIFFQTLSQQWMPNPIQDNSHRVWLTSTALIRLMKDSLHTDKIEYKNVFSLEDYKQIILSENSYVAVVQGNELQMLVNRENVSLKVAQDIMKRA